MKGAATSRTALERLVIVSCLLVAGLLVAGNVLGLPLLLSYVETDSMEPTIEAGDGFVAIPASASGSVEEGDVVVFHAQELDGGGLTTHRVVEVTDQGYVTQGDGNPSPDQDGTEPTVTDGQVVATALQLGDTVVTIPNLGTAVMALEEGLNRGQRQLATGLGTNAVLGPTGLSYLVGALGIVLLVTAVGIERRAHGTRTGPSSRIRNRDRDRADGYSPWRVVLAGGIVLCVVTFATMVAMSGTTELGIVSATFDSEAETVIPAGETDSLTSETENRALFPVVTVVEPASDGVAVDHEPTRLNRGETTTATVAMTAPEKTGYYLRSFAEYRYIGVLPTAVILPLHGVHPWLAKLAVSVTVAGILVLPLAAIVGAGVVSNRDPSSAKRSSK